MPANHRRFPGYALIAVHRKLGLLFRNSRQKSSSQYCLSCVTKEPDAHLGIKLSDQKYSKLLSDTMEFSKFVEQLGLANCPAKRSRLLALDAAASGPASEPGDKDVVAILDDSQPAAGNARDQIRASTQLQVPAEPGRANRPTRNASTKWWRSIARWTRNPGRHGETPWPRPPY